MCPLFQGKVNLKSSIEEENQRTPLEEGAPVTFGNVCSIKSWLSQLTQTEESSFQKFGNVLDLVDSLFNLFGFL